MKKINWISYILLLLLLASYFYWFQYRQLKHDSLDRGIFDSKTISAKPTLSFEKSEEGTVARYRGINNLPSFELYINNDEGVFVGFAFVEGGKGGVDRAKLLEIGRAIKEEKRNLGDIHVYFYKFYDKKKVIDLWESSVSNYSLNCLEKAEMGKYEFSKDKGESLSVNFDNWEFLETECDN